MMLQLALPGPLCTDSSGSTGRECAAQGVTNS
jgi:hypothetical protein